MVSKITILPLATGHAEQFELRRQLILFSCRLKSAGTIFFVIRFPRRAKHYENRRNSGVVVHKHSLPRLSLQLAEVLFISCVVILSKAKDPFLLLMKKDASRGSA